MERNSISSASTSTAQANMGQAGFLFRTPTSSVEPETPNFSQAMGRRKFPHASIPFDYSTRGPTPTFSTPNFSKSLSYEGDLEEERETSRSQPWSTPLEHTPPRVTSQVVPPTSNASHLSEEATNEVYKFLARHQALFRSPQTSSAHGPSFPNFHHDSLATPTYTMTYHQNTQ